MTDQAAIKVRKATPGDLDAIVDLHQPVQSFRAVLNPADFRAVAPMAELRAFFEEKLLAADSAIVIATLGGKPAGYAWFDLQDLPQTPFVPHRRRLCVHQVAVAPEMRRKGVGSALMRFVDAQGLEFAAEEVVLDCWVDDEDGGAFLRRIGFAQYRASLRRRVVGP